MSEGRRTDQKIAFPDSDTTSGELRPDSRMNAGGHEVEGNDGDTGEELLDEYLAHPSASAVGRSMDPVQKLRRRHGRDAELDVPLQHRIDFELAPLGVHEDTRVDQRSHGDRATRAWRVVRSKSSANFGSARGIVFSTSHSSTALHVLGVAGAMVHTVRPLRSIRIVSPRYSTRLSRSENPRAAAVAERRCVRALGDPPEGRPTFREDRGLAVPFFMESDYQRSALQPTLRAGAR